MLPRREKGVVCSGRLSAVVDAESGGGGAARSWRGWDGNAVSVGGRGSGGQSLGGVAGRQWFVTPLAML